MFKKTLYYILVYYVVGKIIRKIEKQYVFDEFNSCVSSRKLFLTINLFWWKKSLFAAVRLSWRKYARKTNISQANRAAELIFLRAMINRREFDRVDTPSLKYCEQNFTRGFALHVALHTVVCYKLHLALIILQRKPFGPLRLYT